MSGNTALDPLDFADLSETLRDHARRGVRG